MKKPLVSDDLGRFRHQPPTEGNAIAAANKPNLDKLFAENPHTQIGASGMDVGLPDGQMGNSEVGHTNIGAGRIVYQELTRITKSIQDGDFFRKRGSARSAVEQRQEKRQRPAFDGPAVRRRRAQPQCSPVRVCWNWPNARAWRRCIVHCFMDGRDVPPSSGKDYVAELRRRSWRRSAWAKSPLSWAATTPWTVTTAGSVWKKPMPPWCTAKA